MIYFSKRTSPSSRPRCKYRRMQSPEDKSVSIFAERGLVVAAMVASRSDKSMKTRSQTVELFRQKARLVIFASSSRA